MTNRSRLMQVAQALFRDFAPDAELTLTDLPRDLGIRVSDPRKGGGTLFVAPDESVLFVGSGMDYDGELAAFEAGKRTPPDFFHARA